MHARGDFKPLGSLIAAKLSRLKQYKGFLERLKEASLEELEEDFKLRGAVERYLHLAIECMIDVGNEMVSALQLRRPERYRDIPEVLAEAGVIPREFAETFASMIGFRNLLVHDYASINLRLLHEFLQTRLGDFDLFAKHIASWLKEKSGLV